MTAEIGKCDGCRNVRRLQGGACEECRTSKSRGPRWIELARRVASDPKFALDCYNRIPASDTKAREAFVSKYGLPEGAEDPRPSAVVIPFRPRR